MIEKSLSSAEVQSKLEQACSYHRQGRLAEAQALYEAVLKVQAGHFDALHLLGVLARQSGRFQQAVELIGRALAVNPDHAPAHNNLGNALLQLKQYRAALQSYDRAIRLKPDYADAYNHRGNALKELKQFDAAINSYQKAIALNPQCVDAYYNCGNAFFELDLPESALQYYELAIAIKPDHAAAYNNRGNAFRRLQYFDLALQSYQKAISFQPTYAEAYNNCGNALTALNRFEIALQNYEKAIALNPKYADAYYNRGNILKELNRFEESLQSYDYAIKLNADYAQAFNNRGNVLKALKRTEAAVDSYDQAIALNPTDADIYFNRGNALKELRQYQAAISSYDKAKQLKPDFEFLDGYRLHAKMNICAWEGIEEQYASLLSAVERGARVSNPFTVLAVSGSPQLQKKAAQIWSQARHPGCFEPQFKLYNHGKIRLGYYSADFHDHATAYLICRLLELHDKSRFEIIGFSFGPEKNDQMRTRIGAALDGFEDVRNLSDRDVADLSRSLEIDIAIDLKGYTQESRPDIFANRAAPIQVGYLGYPATMAAAYIDYLIADPILIPETERHHYTEKIAYLPNSYQANDDGRRISDRHYTRQECGLPDSGFVFCCFNNNYKITPSQFDSWMRILKIVEGSALWLFEGSVAVAQNLRKQASLRGVAAERLVFAAHMPLAEHLARHRLADLFLDTLPCNAHTTASDALWAGLPVLTCLGEGFAGRVAASLLHALDLSELIAADAAEYERLAIDLALNPARLVRLRQKLAGNRLSKPLYATNTYARQLESIYTCMHQRYCAGQPLDHIILDAS